MARETVLLGDLFTHLDDQEDVQSWRSIAVSGIKEDSRRIVSGDIFVAREGEHCKGTDFIATAIERGAVAIIKQGGQPETSNIDTDSYQVPLLSIANLIDNLGDIAAAVFGNVVTKLNVIGITGTNGKTSCAHYLAQALNQLNISTYMIGTLGNGHPDNLQVATKTTPDACSLQQLFAEFYAAGVEAVVMEVSSHALEQGRVQGVPFKVVAYTNLSRDHLDYHGNMSAYAAAKAKLFTQYGAQHCILNADDRYNLAVLEQLKSQHSPCIASYSENSTSGAGFIAQNIQLRQGLAFDVAYKNQLTRITTGLVGKFNIANLLLCIATLSRFGFSLAAIQQSIAKLSPVPGRMQKVPRVQTATQPLCIVDYAHTPDALEKALLASRIHTDGQLIVVFGCGGDRDKGKRAQMASIAERFADVAIITSDNPRTENPDAIIEMIVAGLNPDFNYLVISDRRRAIYRAIGNAQSTDVILIAGKGHEDYQDIMGVKQPFSDEQVVLDALTEQGPYVQQVLL